MTQKRILFICHGNSITPPRTKKIVGTDFCLKGCTERDIEEAKSFFLCFAGLVCKEKTEYSDII